MDVEGIVSDCFVWVRKGMFVLWGTEGDITYHEGRCERLDIRIVDLRFDRILLPPGRA